MIQHDTLHYSTNYVIFLQNELPRPAAFAPPWTVAMRGSVACGLGFVAVKLGATAIHPVLWYQNCVILYCKLL